MAPSLFYTDNTTLISFALIGRLQQLPAILQGKGRVCATVEGEAVRHAKYHSTDSRLQVLSTVAQLLSPIVSADVAEMARAQNLRMLLASPGENRTKHLGEAETLAIIEIRHAKNAVIVTDDDAATRLARNLGIESATTLGLLKDAYNDEVITDEQLLVGLATLLDEGRKAPPRMTSLGAVRQWAAPL